MSMEKTITRSAQERESIIKKIEASKKYLPNYSAFGDNNWNAIDMQVKVIKEGMNDIDKVMSLPCEDEESQNAALGAYFWLIGEEEEDTLIIETN